MRSVVIAIIFWAACGSASFAAAADLDLKGARIGMTLDELNALFPELKCVPSGERSSCVYSRTGMQGRVAELNTLAEEPTNIWIFSFVSGRLGGIYVSFPAGSYRAITDALRAKFGAPTSAIERPVQNRMGAKGRKHSYRDRSPVI